MDLNSFAKLDLRFDQTTDFTKDGFLVNSFDAVKPIVDHIKDQGYTGIQMQTNVPINVDTGNIDLYDENAFIGTQDKSLPDDFWKIAKYASSIGLDVAVRADPVNYINDNILQKNSYLGPNFNEATFFKNLAEYQKQLAVSAQDAGVDIFYIGALQTGWDSADYLSYWETVISQVRSVFSGKIAYLSHYESYNPVWGLVDIISILFDPLLSKSPLYDMKAIVEKYHDVDSTNGVTNTIAAIKQIQHTSGKPVYLDDVRFNAGENALGNYTDYWSMALSSTLIDQQPNTYLQSLRIHSFFEMINTELKTVVDGLSMREYVPWLMGHWTQDKVSNFGKSFHQFSTNGFDLYRQPIAEKSIAYFLKSDNEPIVGTANADNLWIYSGDHVVDGGDGFDQVEFFNPSTYCTISKTPDSVVVQNWVDGTIVLKNVERLNFGDVSVDLDTHGAAGQAYRLYQAAFNRTPDPEGLGYWINALDHGAPLTTVANHFIKSIEFQNLYGTNVSDETFVTNLYHNVLHRSPELEGYNYWVTALQSGAGRNELLTNFSESIENQQNLEPVVATGIQYHAWTFG